MRPRKKDRHLPACVYLKHGAYYLVKGGRWVRLGVDLKPALAEYARLREGSKGGMQALIREAMPIITAKVSSATKTQYEGAARRLEAIFAEFAPHEVLPKHVAQMRRALANTPNMANRLLTVLRLVFHYAVEEQLVDMNPCVGIRRLEEGKRERLIAPGEYDAIHAHAGERLQVIMDLLRLTGQRVSDVLGIRFADLVEDGIYFRQRKTKARLIVRWSPELRQAVERAKALGGNLRALTLLHGRGGKPVDYRTVHDQWVAACRDAGIEDADLRDLRAMSGTEAERQGKDPTKLLGHTSPAMTRRYLRDKEIPVVEGPSFRRVQKGAA